MKREIVVEGQRFDSVRGAAKALECSTTKVYTMMGEKWRAHPGRYSKPDVVPVEPRLPTAIEAVPHWLLP
jgi:hypothetical protein